MNRSMVVSLIGRPNVGKSSLFNRLMKRAHKTITFDRPGVTRDRHYGLVSIESNRAEEKKEIILVDTGGFYPEKTQLEKRTDVFFNIMTEHAQQAIKESDLVLFVVDVREGILPFDQTIADAIRTERKKFWVLINKFDTESQRGAEAEFYSLGVEPEEMFVTSAAHGLGIEDLQEKLYQEIEHFERTVAQSPQLQKGVTPREEVVSRLAIIGAPNAGKSTLLNQLIGASRALVSDIAGTTVDPIEGYFDLYFGEDAAKLDQRQSFASNNEVLFDQYEEFRKNNPSFYVEMLETYHDEDRLLEAREQVADESSEEDLEKLRQAVFEGVEELEEDKTRESFWRTIHLVDTAGIRRKSHIKDFVEGQSVYRALRCISESDIVIFMVDSTKGIGHQDRRLLDIALEKGKSVIVALNKIDLLKDKLRDSRAQKEWLLDLRADVPWLHYVDLVPISAKEKRGLNRLKKVIKKTVLIRHKKVGTGELNRLVFDLVERHPLSIPGGNGKKLKVKYASQVKTSPPTFLLFTNRSKGLPDHYRRYLQNNLRVQLGLDNTPVHLLFRTGKDLKLREESRG